MRRLPSAADASTPCLRVALEAIDAARAKEGVRPMLLPANFSRLTIPEQLFVAIDRERVDRGLTPFTGLATALNEGAEGRRRAAVCPPAGPTPRSGRKWINAVDNGLDADYRWMCDDGPDGGVPGCSGRKTSGCWADRRIVLRRSGSSRLAMGAAFDPSGDASPGGSGCASLFAAMFRGRRDAARHLTPYTWKDALAATTAGTLQPLRSIPSDQSGAGIPDPPNNVQPAPDCTNVCASGLDNCASLRRRRPGRHRPRPRARGRPAHGACHLGFAQLSVPDQLFVAVEPRAGRPRTAGLSAGCAAALNKNAAAGSRAAPTTRPTPDRPTSSGVAECRR